MYIVGQLVSLLQFNCLFICCFLLGGNTRGIDLDKKAVFFVSCAGKDSNNGTKQKPFRTLEKARKMARLAILKKKQVYIYLRGGTWKLNQTLILDERDAGTETKPVVWQAWKNEKVVISGATDITGFTHYDNLTWKANCQLPKFRQLYTNGTKLVRARGSLPAPFKPRGHALEKLSEAGFSLPGTNLAKWKVPTDLELVFMMTWSYMIGKVGKITTDNDSTTITMLQPWFYLLKNKSGNKASFIDRLENAYELIDQPGEWYFNHAEQRLYLYPFSSEDPEKITVTVPQLQTLLKIQGTNRKKKVGFIQFKGINFEYSNWNEPSERGLIDIQASFCLDSARLFTESNGDISNTGAEFRKTPGAVVLSNVQYIQFNNCSFQHLGGSGLDLEAGSSFNTIENCHFADIAANGIQIGDVQAQDHHPTDSTWLVKYNRIINNTITRCGTDYEDAVGIWAGYVSNTTIKGNHVYNLPYSGISCGWGWGLLDSDSAGKTIGAIIKGPTPAGNNLIANNIINNVMRKRRDGGAIYTLGAQPGTLITNNLMYENPRAHDIYLDEGSSGITVEKNTIYPFENYPDTVKNHVVKRLLKTNLIRNNFFFPNAHFAIPNSQKVGHKH